jgi:hypothetical protein
MLNNKEVLFFRGAKFMKTCKTLVLIVVCCVIFSSVVATQTNATEMDINVIDLDRCCEYLASFIRYNPVTIDELNHACGETWKRSSFLDRKDMKDAYHECWPTDTAGFKVDDGGANDDSDSLAPKVGR